MPIAPATPPFLFQPGLEVGATRIIQEKGIYILTDAEMGAWRLRVLLDVIVQPPVGYRSYKPNEPENFFGYFQLVEGGFVIEQYPIKYLHQQIFRYQNDPAKNLFDSKVEGIYAILATFNAGAAILNSIPGSANLTYSSHVPGNHLQCPVTDIWIKTVPGCKVAIHTEYLPLPRIDGVPASTTSPQSLPSPSAPGDNTAGGNGSPPEDAPPTREPDPPYDPPTNDNDRTTPTGNAEEGQWFAIISGIDGNGQTYSGFRFALPGATNGSIEPILTNVQPTLPEGYFKATVLYNGAIVNQPDGYSSYTFEFVP